MPKKKYFCKHPTNCQEWAVSAGLCIKHGAPRRFCKWPGGCKKWAQRAGLCKEHGAPRRFCQFPKCTNHMQRVGLCFHHGGHQFCNRPTCENFAATGGICVTHGGGPRCVNEAHANDETPPHAKYPGRLCWGCFTALHPERAKSKVRKEIMVLAELERRCGDLFERATKRTWDCPVEGGCSLKRPDLLLDFGTWAVVVEVDELYHEDLSCWDEESRLNVIAADVQMPLAILRLKVDKPSCFGNKRCANGEPVLVAKKPFHHLMQRAEECLRKLVDDFGGPTPPPPAPFLAEVTLTGEVSGSSSSSSD